MSGGLALWSIAEQACKLNFRGGRLLEASEPSHLVALETFDKAGVVAAHSRLRNSAAVLEKRSREGGTFASTLPSHLDPLCMPVSLHSSSPPPLKSVTLKDLQTGACNSGCKLHGKLEASAFRFSNIVVSAVEDETGSVARLLALNSVHWDCTPEEVKRRYPRGAQVVIKEPTLAKLEFCEGTALWLPNPASMEFVSFSSPESSGDGDCQHWLKLGIAKLGIHEFREAVDCFTQCIRQGGDRDLIVEALALRAEAWLAIGSYLDKAIADVEQGLTLDPVHPRCLLVKGQALVMQGQYEASHICIEQAAKHQHQHQHQQEQQTRKLERALADSVKFKEQSTSGTGYEDGLSKYYLAGCREVDAPNMAEYVGPVKVAMTRDGKGRGLFLTKDVRKGELIVVSNAVALVFPTSDVARLDKRGLLLNEVLRACIGSARTLAQVETLAERDFQTGNVISKELPSMELFLPNMISEARSLKLNVARISGIVSCVSESSVEEDVLVSSEALGLWTLPSFINHSCLPNVSLHRVGRSLLIVASTDSSAGSELLRSYGSVLTPWNSMRTEEMVIKRCRCERCALEEKLLIPLEDLSSRYDCTLKAEFMLESEFHQELSKVALDLEAVLEYDTELTRRHKSWLRASYWPAYLSYYYSSSSKSSSNSEGFSGGIDMPAAEEIMEALHVTAPGSNKTLMAMCCFDEYRKNGGGTLVLEEECTSLCGKHSPEVTRSIIQQAMKKGKDTFW